MRLIPYRDGKFGKFKSHYFKNWEQEIPLPEKFGSRKIRLPANFDLIFGHP